MTTKERCFRMVAYLSVLMLLPLITCVKTPSGVKDSQVASPVSPSDREATSVDSDSSKAHSFKSKTLSGKKVSFPDDYKGRIVLIEFWATWCGPCIREIPQVVDAYERFHDNGFDVLGISLDRENEAEMLKEFLNDHKMTWPQIYDGKKWESSLVKANEKLINPTNLYKPTIQPSNLVSRGVD